MEKRERDRTCELERRLLVRYRRDRDLRTREQIVRRFIPLARELARRYVYTGEPLDDLSQVALLGLIKAVDRFDPDRGVRFTSYAAPTILGELKRHFRDQGWAVHVPRDLRDRAVAVTREIDSWNSPWFSARAYANSNSPLPCMNRSPLDPTYFPLADRVYDAVDGGFSSGFEGGAPRSGRGRSTI